MDAEAREAVELIREPVEADRYLLTVHFRDRLAQRGMHFWDVVTILEEPGDARGDGVDDQGAGRWLVRGDAGLGEVEFVVTVNRAAKLVTIYWT